PTSPPPGASASESADGDAPLANLNRNESNIFRPSSGPTPTAEHLVRTSPGTMLAFAPILRDAPPTGDGRADGRRATPTALARRHLQGALIHRQRSKL